MLLLASLDHRGPLVRAALIMAKLGVKEIVDQLHVHIIKGSADSETAVEEV